MMPVALGFRAQRGGSVVVGVAAGPRILLSTFLSTAAEGDRLSLEPYHVAFEMGREATPEAKAAVAEGRARQDALAAEGLARLIGQLEAMECTPVAAALLVNRAGWITDLMQHSLSDPAHPPVAEGLAVRDALRFAFGRCGLAVTEMDEKSLAEAASLELGLPPGEPEARLRAFSAKPWRKEQKLACLAAWLAIAQV